MKNKKKSIVIISCIVLIVIFVVSLLLTNNNGNADIEERLILDCSKSTEVNGFSITLSKKMYTIGDEKKYVDGMNSNIKSEYLNGETLSDYYEYQEAALKDQINKSFGSDYKYVKLVTKINGENATFNIEYTINNESKEYIAEILNTNIFDISTQEVLSQLEKEEFSCKSF